MPAIPRPSAPLRPARSRASSALLACVLLHALPGGSALAQPIERGRALYETRCIACHDRSVHQRTARKAGDLAALRREVERWNATTGGDWKAEEIDAVTGYLNAQYYRFECPPAGCALPSRAQVAPGSR
jgi:mono/diheme cytochrome c family protein